MTKPEAASRIKKLRDQINDYRYHYHVLDQSIMSEAAADSLKHELSELEQQFPDLITSDSPTQRVAGKPLEKFVAVRHLVPMLSLNDVFSRDELEGWSRRCQKLLGHSIKEYFVEVKKDGLAGTLVYQDGVLVQGLTRGDGTTGEDVTANFRTIESVPLALRRDPEVPKAVYQGRFEVRGEVLLYQDDFAALNRQRSAAGLPLFANPRNTAAGTMRQLDARLVAQRRLRFLAYLVAGEIDGAPTLAAEQAIAAKAGFAVEPHSQVLGSINAVMEFAGAWEERRKTLPFGTDGLVITVNDNADFARLGVVGKAPRGAVAYKFPAEQATTRVKDIMVSIGRTGAATPFAVLEPTLVAGSTIQMATLHNESEVQRKDIRIGDTVIIQKAGDVIPEVVASLPKLRTGAEQLFKMPKNCPNCGTELVKTYKEAIWRCPNYNCFALERGRLIHFASKGAFDIEGLGEQTVDALLESKLIADAADLFHLTVDDVAGMPRFAQKSAENLVGAIKERQTVTLDRFIYALGIRHVGAQTAIDLAGHFGTLDNFRRSTLDALRQVSGIGEVVAASVAEWLGSQRGQEFLDKLAREGVAATPMRVVRGKLSGQSFVITGTLDSFSREVAEERIKALGGKAQSSVTKETSYLVVGADPGASKITKAQKLGTPQLDEAALLKLLES
ncbi:MAG TPA: NAD-dependent DNA ligase LigA [Candidatus Saccharimonadales bacterium]|nr:NAD-dependent DNA ligase LigA [Candidatus Saccharimonadales bacterium]